MNDINDKIMLKPELWVDNFGDILYSFALKRVNNEIIAQDLVQETFLGALKSKANFKGESSEKTWLIAILKFKIIDYYRIKSKEKTSELHQSNGEDIDDLNFESNNHWKTEAMYIGNFEQADAKLERNEFYDILNKCVEKLPNKLATVFKLKMLLEEKTEVICENLNVTESNYWVILHRAKLQLRNCMHNNWNN